MPSPGPSSYLLPFNRPDLLSTTHPPNHNAVLVLGSNSSTHRQQEREYKNLDNKDKAAEKEDRLEGVSEVMEGASGVVEGVSELKDVHRYVDTRGTDLHWAHGGHGGGYRDEYGPLILPDHTPVGECVGTCGGTVSLGGAVRSTSNNCSQTYFSFFIYSAAAPVVVVAVDVQQEDREVVTEVVGVEVSSSSQTPLNLAINSL